MTVQIRLLGPGDESVLAQVAPAVFDDEIDANLAREFLADPHLHIAVAVESGTVVGFASGADYIHPDKPRELFVNEVGMAPTHRRRGIAKAVLEALLAHGRALGCKTAWVLTDSDNKAARALYASAGGRELADDTVHIEFGL